MTFYCFYGGVVTVHSGVGAYAILQGILGRNYQIYAVEASLAGKIFHDGKMAYVQRIE